MKTRREFIKATTVTTAVSLIPMGSSVQGAVQGYKLKLGVASYSLREFTKAKAIAMAKRAGLDYICFGGMHLPLSATPTELEDSTEKVNDAGLTWRGHLYGRQSSRDQAFEYAKIAGMSVIVGVPEHDLLDYTNEKIKQYDIKVAIHNQ